MSSTASFSPYDITVPVFSRGLKTFDHILHKAEAFAKEKGIDVDAEFAQARLVEDQYPFVVQVRYATNTVRNYVLRLTGEDIAPFEDNETTFAELHVRIQSAQELLNKVTPDVANARGESETASFTPGGVAPVTLSVKDAVLFQGIPNFFFHLTTGYSILRAKGVPVGKADFIANFLEVPGFE